VKTNEAFKKGYARNWATHLQLMADICAGNDLSPAISLVDRSFSQRNRDKRLTAQGSMVMEHFPSNGISENTRPYLLPAMPQMPDKKTFDISRQDQETRGFFVEMRSSGGLC
jgi:hypothetical protein